MRQLSSVNLLNGLPLVRRPSPVPVSPWRLYLPVRKPPPSGLQGQIPIPSSCAAGNVLALDVALDERVLQLQRRDAFLALLLGERVRARHIPGGSVGKAVVANLAGAHQIGERVDHFFHRRHRVPGVQPIQIDEIGIQPFERRVDGAVDVLAAVAARIGIAGRAVEGEFSGQHDLVAQLAIVDKLPAHLFALAALVAVGGVDEVAPGIDIAVEDGARDGFIGAPAPLRSKGHRAQAERADAQSGASQGDVAFQVHVVMIAWALACARAGLADWGPAHSMAA